MLSHDRYETTDATPPRKTALVVLGMHRSGTSAMAGTLSLCGAQLPADPLPANFANPAGYFEPQPVTTLNDELLELLDSEWDDIFAGRPKSYLSNFDRVYQQRASETLDSQYGDAQFIVLKDPRINVLAPFWNRVLVNRGYEPLYIVMVRNPLEVARSLGERDGFPMEKGLLLWLENMVSAERDTRSHRRIFVAYEDLLSNWAGVIDRIESSAEVPMPRRTSSAANAVGAYLSTRHRHHVVADVSLLERSPTGRRVRDAYAMFLAAARGEDIEALPRLSAIEAALAETRDDLGPVLADFRTRIRRAEAEAAAQRAAAEQQAAAAGTLQAELQSAAAQTSLLAAQRETDQAELAAARERIAALTAEAATGLQNMERADARTVELATELEVKSKALAQARSETEEAQSRSAQIEAAAQLERAVLGNRVDALEAERDAAHDLMTVARAQAEQALDDVNRVRDRIEHERKDLEADLVVATALKESALALQRQGEAKLNTLLAQAREAERRNEAQRQSTVGDMQSAIDKLAAAEQALAAVTSERDAIVASTSWRLTSLPRRALSRFRTPSSGGGA